jgi:hypothetical protein
LEDGQAAMVHVRCPLERFAGKISWPLSVAAIRSRVGAGRSVMLQTVRERGLLGVRKDSRTRYETHVVPSCRVNLVAYTKLVERHPGTLTF